MTVRPSSRQDYDPANAIHNKNADEVYQNFCRGGASLPVKDQRVKSVPRRLHTASALNAPVRGRSIVGSLASAVCSWGCRLMSGGRHEITGNRVNGIWLSRGEPGHAYGTKPGIWTGRTGLERFTCVSKIPSGSGLAVEVLDEALGIVSAKKFDDYEPTRLCDPSSLSRRRAADSHPHSGSWGPFTTEQRFVSPPCDHVERPSWSRARCPVISPSE